ncbi:MAG: hypothetical protein J1E38_00230 [Paramuribaculum sp.]|nr:hypothetical protein [Paramuribaculum sp.]
MITKKVIDAIYKACPKPPANPDDLNVDILFEKIEDPLAISFDDRWLVLHTVPENSPFHKIELKRIHCIEEFEDEVAIVLHSSIIFLNKKDGVPHVHIREERPSFMEKLRYKILGVDD